eukprot:7488-Pleurochrysis_carterae.AAC.2
MRIAGISIGVVRESEPLFEHQERGEICERECKVDHDEDSSAEAELKDGGDGGDAVDQQREGGGHVGEEERDGALEHCPVNARLRKQEGVGGCVSLGRWVDGCKAASGESGGDKTEQEEEMVRGRGVGGLARRAQSARKAAAKEAQKMSTIQDKERAEENEPVRDGSVEKRRVEEEMPGVKQSWNVEGPVW